MTLITENFFKNSQNTPEKLAIWCDGKTMTYKQLATLVNRWSRALISRGVSRGESIGVLLPNSIEFVALILVAAELGLVLVPLNAFLPVSAIQRAFQASEVKHVVAQSSTLKPLLSTASSEFSFVDGLWLSIDNGHSGVETLDNLIKNTSPDYEAVFDAKDEDPFILTMTSGSTGDPKPIVLKQITKFNRAIAAIKLYNITASDIILAATPLYHSLAERLVLIPLITGGTSILMPRYSTSEWLKCVEEQSVTFTIAVSSQLRNIAEQLSRSVNVNKISSLRCVVSSSERLDSQVKSDLISKLHCQFHECYGASEIAIATNLDNESGLTKLNSVGKAAPGVDIKILLDNGEIAIDDEPGEIICKTPMIFGGYFKRPELTKDSMWGDYFRTGDIGKMDDDGYLYFLGRKKDIIISGGINIYPQDIELVISEHTSVMECAAFALPDGLGEIIAVAIVPRDTENFDKRKIRILCAERLADFQQPRKYFIVEELPKNGVGKIMKNSLASYCTTKKNME